MSLRPSQSDLRDHQKAAEDKYKYKTSKRQDSHHGMALFYVPGATGTQNAAWKRVQLEWDMCIETDKNCQQKCLVEMPAIVAGI